MLNPILQKALADEEQRQALGLELIPSENYASSDVRSALSSVFTNKYSEGYPGARYYGGQENTDVVEQYAIDVAKKLFGADHANVQPHSGAQANEAVYHSWLEPGDTVLAMDLSHGGHLTHGHPVTVLARQFNFVRYGMKDIATGEIDFDQVEALAEQHKPKILLVGFSSYPRSLDYARFASIGNKYGCLLVADIAHIAGLIAGKALPNPFDFGFHVLTSTTHKSLRGPRGGLILSKGTVSSPLKAPEKTIDNMPTLIDRTVFPGLQGGPLMNTIFAKAVAFDEALQPDFSVYAEQVIKNAAVLAGELMAHGLQLVTSGTDNHLLLIDMVATNGTDGKRAEELLDQVGLTCNKNVVPDDKLPAFAPSGLRIGTPAATTRGMKEPEMKILADVIQQVLLGDLSDEQMASQKARIERLAKAFPAP